MAAATSRVRSGFQVEAMATPTGKTVATSPSLERTPVGPSATRTVGTPRRSTPCRTKGPDPAMRAIFSRKVSRDTSASTRSSSGKAGSAQGALPTAVSGVSMTRILPLLWAGPYVRARAAGKRGD